MVQQLSPQVIAIVKATAPMLEDCGIEIMTKTYEQLLKDRNVGGLFGHTDAVSWNETCELSAAILEMGLNLDRLDLLAAPIAMITARHIAMGIKPEHYSCIADALLPQVHAALGPAATREARAAWKAAFWYIADILIAFEAAFYRRAAITGDRRTAA